MHPIVLEVDYLEGSDAFEVSVWIEGKKYREIFTRVGFTSLCGIAATFGFTVGGFFFTYSCFDKRDVGPRARRSFKQYFQSVLERHKK